MMKKGINIIIVLCIVALFALGGRTTISWMVDGITDAIVTITYEHHEIHGGSFFYVKGFDADMDDGDTIDFQITTPNTRKWTHMDFEVISTRQLELHIYEEATFAGDGDAITPLNKNRNSSNTSGMTVQSNGTVSAIGTDIYPHIQGDATNPSRYIGGLVDRDHEIILKQNTSYRFVLESNIDNNVVTYEGLWYEHTTK